MADLSDVENAMVGEVINALYPSGTSQPSVVGVTCHVYRGWPSPAALNSDLAAGIVNVTVFPAMEADELPDSYFDRQYAAIPAITLLATVTGQSVTLSGMVADGQIIGLLVDGVPFSYVAQQDDTPDSIAANLMTLISEIRAVNLSGSTLTVPGVITLIARVVMNTTVLQGVRHQRREVHASCWCPSPGLRDSVCSIVDLALATSPFIDLSDGTQAHVRYVSTQVYDQSQSALLYRRDLNYKLEFTVASSTVAPVMLFGDCVRNRSDSFV